MIGSGRTVFESVVADPTLMHEFVDEEAEDLLVLSESIGWDDEDGDPADPAGAPSSSEAAETAEAAAAAMVLPDAVASMFWVSFSI